MKQYNTITKCDYFSIYQFSASHLSFFYYNFTFCLASCLKFWMLTSKYLTSKSLTLEDGFACHDPSIVNRVVSRLWFLCGIIYTVQSEVETKILLHRLGICYCYFVINFRGGGIIYCSEDYHNFKCQHSMEGVINTRNRPISFFKPLPIFSKNVTDIWPVANIRLTTDADIPKFAYQ